MHQKWLRDHGREEESGRADVIHLAHNHQAKNKTISVHMRVTSSVKQINHSPYQISLLHAWKARRLPFQIFTAANYRWQENVWAAQTSQPLSSSPPQLNVQDCLLIYGTRGPPRRDIPGSSWVYEANKFRNSTQLQLCVVPDLYKHVRMLLTLSPIIYQTVLLHT